MWGLQRMVQDLRYTQLLPFALKSLPYASSNYKLPYHLLLVVSKKSATLWVAASLIQLSTEIRHRNRGQTHKDGAAAASG